MRVMG